MKLGICSRSQPALEDSESVVSAKLDVCDEKAVDAFALDVEERFGAIDLWINNAGVLEPIKPLRDVSLAEFRDHIDINLLGVFLSTRAYVRHLHRRLPVPRARPRRTAGLRQGGQSRLHEGPRLRRDLPGGGTGTSTVDDCVLFLARFSGGAVGSFEATRLATGNKNRNTIEINGDRGHLATPFNQIQYALPEL